MSVEWVKKLPVTSVAFFADKHKVDFNLVLSIIKHESSCNQYTTRFEPEAYQEGKYFVTPEFFAKKLGTTIVTEKIQQYTSWGLMQIMGFRLRELGFNLHFPLACSYVINLEYGCKILAQLSKKYKTVGEVVSAYNQGSPRLNAQGEFKNNLIYVQPILKTLQELKDANT